MPTSHCYQVDQIVEHIMVTQPHRLLDIGIGFGKYGFLAREYLEFWDDRHEYTNWHCQIDGIEAFPEYIRSWHEQIYNHIFIGNALDVVPTLTDFYDLTLLIDVLEHFTYEDGCKLLQLLQEHTRNILVSTPKDIGVQGDKFGNVFETHRFQWQPRHFRSFPHVIVPNFYSWIIYCGPDVHRLQRVIRRNHQREFLKRYGGPTLRLYRRFYKPVHPADS